MNTDVLPHYEAPGAKIEVVLTDIDRELSVRPDLQLFELLLQLEKIEHRSTKARLPLSSGIVERLHRMSPDEHFRGGRCRSSFETVEEMQTVLDVYLEVGNHRRPNPGQGLYLRPDQDTQKPDDQTLPKIS